MSEKAPNGDEDFACGCVNHHGQVAPAWAGGGDKLGWIEMCTKHDVAHKFNKRTEAERDADNEICKLVDRAERERKFAGELKAKVDDGLEKIAAMQERAFEFDEALDAQRAAVEEMQRALIDIEDSLAEIESAANSGLAAIRAPPKADSE